ncbi:MAG: hypothetical protein AB7I41_03265 [Candidatus Sericytochromatia bacterium]
MNFLTKRPAFHRFPGQRRYLLRRQAAFGWLLGVCLWIAPVFAQTPSYTQPLSDAQGNWLTNAGPVSGQAKSPQTPGALWRVVSPQLNCRAQPSRHAALIVTFRQGQLLQANLGRGGSDEVFFNALDRAQHPWMWVRSPQGDNLNCFVRAHRSFILPLKAPAWQRDKIHPR